MHINIVKKIPFLLPLLTFLIFLTNSACLQKDSTTRIESTNITAKIEKIEVSLESIMYYRVFIKFINHSDKVCKLKGYRISWQNNSKNIVLSGVSLKPKQIIIRVVRIYSFIEDNQKLKVVVFSDCN